MASYVLVHGAGFGANCWDRLTPLLEAAPVGGRVLAVDLPGRGKRAGTDVRTVTLDDCAEAILADVGEADLHDIVLVAHSFAGVVVPRVMPPLADRLSRVVFVSAVVPPDGTAVIDGIDPGVRAAVEETIAGGIYAPGPDASRAMLCNDMDDDLAAWTLERLVDESAALLTEVVDISGLEGTPVPRTYVRLSEDRCYVPDLQERSSRLVGGDEVHLPSGHMPMVSMPDRLAAVLTEQP
jgi:pimeloyl-ACP methyl ester carboxylesterase